MLLITPEYPDTDTLSSVDFSSSVSELLKSIERCIDTLQGLLKERCFRFSWKWILLVPTGRSGLYNNTAPEHLIVIEESTSGPTHIPQLININDCAATVIQFFSELESSENQISSPVFTILLSNLLRPLSSDLIFDIRDFLACYDAQYMIATSLRSLLSDASESSSGAAYEIRGDALLILRHVAVLLTTDRDLDFLVEAATDDDLGHLDSKLRLCLGLISPRSGSCVIYVDTSNNRLAICFGEINADEASISLSSYTCTTDNEGAPTRLLVQFCAYLEAGMHPQEALRAIQ